jgi:hypothetical protein
MEFGNYETPRLFQQESGWVEPQFPHKKSGIAGRFSVISETSLEEAGMITTFLGQDSS